MRNKVYRDPRGSLISMEMLGIAVRSWSFGGGRSPKAKHMYVCLYVSMYECMYGGRGVEKQKNDPRLQAMYYIQYRLYFLNSKDPC